MRFVFAIVSLVLAVVLLGYGLAQRTILKPPSSVSATAEMRGDAAVTVIGGAALNGHDGRQQVEISGADAIFVAYGRGSDVDAWVGDATHNVIDYDVETEQFETTVVEGTEAAVPAPAGSDLWLREYAGVSELDFAVNLDDAYSLIVVSDGTAPAPTDVSVSWPIDDRMPWAGPLLAAGGGFLLLALLFFLWGLLHHRRGRGPRRNQPKGPRMPKLPKQRAYKVPKPKAIDAARGRRAVRRGFVAIPLALVATLTLASCSADAWSDFVQPEASSSTLASPSGSGSAEAEPESDPPALTVSQLRAIVGDVAAVAAASDASLDVEGLKARFDGAALALRQTAYTVRGKDSASSGFPTAIPTGSVEVTLPQQTTTWPRVAFAVVGDDADETIAPVAMMLVQNSAREQYKATYLMTLEPGAVLPELAPEGVGTSRVRLDSKLLVMQPDQLAAAYADVLTVGSTSASYPLFDVEKDLLIPQQGFDKQAERKASLEAESITVEAATTPGATEVIAMSSNDSGALVALTVDQTEKVTPAKEGDVSPEANTKTLSGVEKSTKGFTTTYTDQLLFYIPPASEADGKVLLLGYSYGLVAASEVP